MFMVIALFKGPVLLHFLIACFPLPLSFPVAPTAKMFVYIKVFYTEAKSHQFVMRRLWPKNNEWAIHFVPSSQGEGDSSQIGGRFPSRPIPDTEVRVKAQSKSVAGKHVGLSTHTILTV